MIRVLAFIRRLPGVSRDAFRTHYEEVHVPIALPSLGGTTGYLRHHVREELHGAADFDCMTRFEYPDATTVRAVFERTEGPQGEAIRRDERTFMDKPAIVFFPVEESPAWYADDRTAQAGTNPARLLVCVRRPEAEPSGGFRTRFLDQSLRALRAAVEAPRWTRSWWALAGGPQARGFDAVSEIGAGGPGELARWARELDREGASVIAVRVSVHETQLPGQAGG